LKTFREEVKKSRAKIREVVHVGKGVDGDIGDVWFPVEVECGLRG
jgi:hypothetical protein